MFTSIPQSLHFLPNASLSNGLILPSLSEQAEIYFRYTSINEKQKREKELLSKLVLQKNGLMQDLLTGKVQVTI